jgi:hypothetical protein
MFRRIKFIIILILSLVTLALIGLIFFDLFNQPMIAQAIMASPHVWESEEQEALPLLPWSDAEEVAISKVRERLLSLSNQPADPLNLEDTSSNNPLFAALDPLPWDRVEQLGWTAFQLESSVYEVRYVYKLDAIEFGPSWLVQLDEEGLQPAHSGGVVPANFMGEIVAQLPSSVSPYPQRSDEVITLLTHHEFTHGQHLGPTLLSFFQQRTGSLNSDQIIGWTVLPIAVENGIPIQFRASFQWREENNTLAAEWVVHLDNNILQSQNLLAAEIMHRGESQQTDLEVEFIPEALSRRASRRERNRWLATMVVAYDPLLKEFLLNAYSQNARNRAELSVHWSSSHEGLPEDHYTVSLDILPANGPEEIWLVDLSSETAYPQSELALTADLVFNNRIPPEEEVHE